MKKLTISVRNNFEEEGKPNCLIKNLYEMGIVASLKIYTKCITLLCLKQDKRRVRWLQRRWI